MKKFAASTTSLNPSTKSNPPGASLAQPEKPPKPAAKPVKQPSEVDLQLQQMQSLLASGKPTSESPTVVSAENEIDRQLAEMQALLGGGEPAAEASAGKSTSALDDEFDKLMASLGEDPSTTTTNNDDSNGLSNADEEFLKHFGGL
jgi:hypothetical protein